MGRIGCHRVIRGHDRRWLTVPFTQDGMEDESLGFVEECWVTVEIKVALFDESEFDAEMASFQTLWMKFLVYSGVSLIVTNGSAKVHC